MKRVVVTGMGVICPIGLNLEEFWTNLAAGKSGVNTISSFDASNHAAKVAGEVRNFDPTEHMDLKTVQRTRRAI
ncbi:MAG: beta-ketoacyl synthase N-terminal-like domain-containing protein, partial [Dehalococcoidia bacterium]